MLEPIRPATVEEVASIADKSDLGPGTGVWIWPNEDKEPDLGVLRVCHELDPVHFGNTSGNQRKLLFLWSMLNMARASGIRTLYFDIDAEGSEEYLATLEKMGAQRTTTKPQYRLRFNL